MDRGLKKIISGNPAATGPQYSVPTFSMGIGADGQPVLSPGDGTVPGRQGTPEEAARGNANYVATGNSTPAGGFGATGSGTLGTGELGTLSANAQQGFNDLAAQRGATARDMYAQGQAAQGRTAAQTGMVDYGSRPEVSSTNAAKVNYGPAQTIAAPTLASARQAAMGDFGSEQRVSAQQVGPAAQASAERATATSAANQAGFLAGTAAGARGLADIDFGQADQSREAMGAGLNRINAFVDQGPGESQALAQLRMAQEENLGAALSMARSGRGNAAGNMKMAISENAATNAQTNQQAALLRANEADLWRGRQLQGLGLAQEGATAMRGQDIGAATAQGQHAVSREQIASNVDVNRAGLEQALAQFNAGAQNQASLTNAQLGTQTNLQNAEQTNLGSRLNAQLGTEAAIQEAALANSRNVAMGQTGSQVNMSNAEQANLTSRLQGQLSSDAAIQQAGLANQLAIAQGNSGTELSTTNANNASAAARMRAELANQLAIAQGNSSTDLTRANLEAQIRQKEANDRLMADLYGQGVDLGGQQINAGKNAADSAFNYADLAADIEGRNLDRKAGLKTASDDRKAKKEGAYISGLATLLESIT
jgi:hypothetical protein